MKDGVIKEREVRGEDIREPISSAQEARDMSRLRQ